MFFTTPHIIQANIRDAEVLSQLSEQTFRDAYTIFNTPENMEKYVSQYLSLEPIKQQISDAANTFFLVLLNDKAIGYAKLRPSLFSEEIPYENAIEIERIYVQQEYQKQKIGEALMEFCIGYAKQKEFQFIWLGVWENNPKAIRFYEKCGFTTFGNHPFLFGDDLQNDILMVRRVI